MYFSGRKTWMAATLVAAAVLAGCSSTSVNRAPVEDRGTAGAPRVDPATLPGAENAGKPGFYTVRQGWFTSVAMRMIVSPWRTV